MTVPTVIPIVKPICEAEILAAQDTDEALITLGGLRMSADPSAVPLLEKPLLGSASI
ncbi:hypothetical protein [Methylobacterium sp. J-067]|uniref:hypothetical protein n=1 Tax=Methylobacterium sp. J-067 TaxID=2836648 RepID=UPI001FBA4371|nr:hypothetical protein [Methylobacterium sp. J-067]MCJ2026694.1 hypothetical protein [Methylobacterium sp. J-067]